MKYLLTCLVFLSSIYCQTFNPESLDFQISIEKDTFLLDEPIFVEMKETNISAIDVMSSILNIEFRDFVFVQLISSDGENLNKGPGTVHGRYDRPSTGKILGQGDSRFYVFRLNYYFGKMDPRDNAIHTRYLPTGNYTLQVTHFTNANYMYEKINGPDPNNVTKMPVVSNELSFTVVQPSGNEEQERSDYLYAIQQNLLNRRDNKSVAYEHLRMFYLKYPDSPYLSHIIYRSFYTSEVDISGKRFLTIAEALDRNKQSYSSFLFRGNVKSLYPDLANDKRRITPTKIAAERAAIRYAGSKFGAYLTTESRELQSTLDRMQAQGKVEKSY